MRTRALAVIVLAAVALFAAWQLLAGGDGYSIAARFQSAGQLVNGGEVRVAGRKVGSIAAIRLTPDGQAEVELDIEDDSLTPLREGTRADIRAVGAAGVANRFVDLAPGSARNAPLESGAVLPTTQTSGIVELDALLNVFDRSMRADAQALIARGQEVFAGSGSTYYNSMLGKLSPGLREISAVSEELASDEAQLGRLVKTAAATAEAVAARRPDLIAAIDGSARWMDALADERESVSSALRHAPATLRGAQGTLRRVDGAVTALRPVLRDLPSAGPPLDELLRRVRATLPVATPVAAELRRQLPGLRASLAGLRPLERPLRKALTTTKEALSDAQPILGPTRMYAPDLILGVVNGLAGVAVGSYDAGGHYARLEFVQPPQTFLGGQMANLFSRRPLVPGLFDQRIRQTRRCPGGALPPAPDRSNADIAGEPLCDPSMNMPESVNHP